MRRPLLGLTIPAILLGITACQPSGVHLYLDKNSFTDGDITFSFSEFNEQKTDSYLFGTFYDATFKIKVRAAGQTETHFTLTDSFSYNETKKEKVQTFSDMYVTVRPKETNNLLVSLTLSTSSRSENYYFHFVYNQKDIYYHLFYK